MRILRLFLPLAFIFTATLTAAACGGADVRDTLTPAEQAEIDARLAHVPFAEGNVWTATRGAQVLHLIGTMHLDDTRFDAIMPRLLPLIRNANLLLVEATKAEEAKLESAVTQRPDLLFLTTGPTLPDLLPEADWQALAEAVESRGVPAFMAAKMQPWYLSVLLTMPGCAVQQMQDGANGLDHRIMDLATRAGVPQQPLEPFDTVFNLMSGYPLEEQARLLTLGLLSNDIAEDAFFTLKESYFEEKSAELLEVNRIIAYRHVDLPKAEVDALTDEMLGTLLNQRNLAWMTPILSAPEGETVVAVGAAHLPGAQGLLALLEAEGFRIQRQPF